MWTNFTKNLPESFETIWSILNQEGLTPILIGGVPRDYLLTGKIGDDWDLEVVHQQFTFDTGLWKRVGKALSEVGSVHYLPFDIIRLKLKTVTYEFSAPRLEKFSDNWARGGHKNFEATLSLNLPFAEAVKRRDLTINAIGLKFIKASEVEMLDPLSGQLHLDDETLLPCSEDFIKDPIRFFRALRFSLKLGFQIAPKLDEMLKSMPLQYVPAVHVWSEIQKSQNPKEFFELLNKYKPYHPEWKSDWVPKFSEDETVSGFWIESPARFMLWLALSDKKTEAWQQMFGLSQKDSQNHERLGESLRLMRGLSPKDFHGGFEAILALTEFEKISDVYFSLKNMQSREREGFVLKLLQDFAPAWQKLFSFEVIKDVREIEPPLRAKYQVWNLCQKL